MPFALVTPAILEKDRQKNKKRKMNMADVSTQKLLCGVLAQQLWQISCWCNRSLSKWSTAHFYDRQVANGQSKRRQKILLQRANFFFTNSGKRPYRIFHSLSSIFSILLFLILPLPFTIFLLLFIPVFISAHRNAILTVHV